jgi:hypothetical protein
MTISDPTNFSMDVGGGPNPMGSMTPTIPSGESRTMAVSFNPSSDGTFAADIDIEFGEQEILVGTQGNDNNGRKRRVGWTSLRLFGKGVPNPVPNISMAPRNNNFGDVLTGNLSGPVEITISNTGSAELHVSGIVLSDTTNFTLDVNGGPNPCGSTPPTIPTGQNCTVSARFGPFSTGTFSSTLRVDSDDPDTPSLNVSLSGEGISTPVPNITLSPLSYSFGDVVTENSSSPREITISNTGSAELHVSGIVLSDTTNFTLDVNGGPNPCGSTSPTIPTGQNCTVSARFGPFSTGVFSSTLRVDSDDPDTPSLGVSLTGSGTLSPPADKTITLAWDPPTTDVNGNPISNLGGYILYYGPSPGNYDHSIDVGNVTTYSVTLPPGAWYLSTRAYIAQGFESDYSNEIQVNI